MAEPGPILINDSLSIPRAELEFRATRSGGPGGQHVNTSATRVQLTWNVAASPSLSDAQRARILTRLATRIDERGVLQLTASGSRSQYQNRVEVTERFAVLLAQALKVPKPRKKTRPSKKVREARLQSKRRRSETKRRRRDVDAEE
ncbi:MAG TPA: alternative ribosome rescue aminoacyl-tRNA hydrolase ArfB [Longimicrobiales bacterium]|nr:alternative ribosome rescue aminoacyl-tRNA hydrolase ArfB [Longimicrobiales bacterium]